MQSTISRKTIALHRNILPFNHVPPCDSDLPVVSRTPVSRRKIIEKHISDLQDSDSSDPEIIQIKTRTIRTNQNYSVDSFSSSDANEHDFALFQNEFQSSENIGDGTEEAFGNTIQRILYLLVVDRISQFHRLCREGLQDLQSYNTIQYNTRVGVVIGFLCRNTFYAENCFFMPNNCFYADCFYDAV